LNTAIAKLYNEYVQETGDKMAAASLTLAELMQDEPTSSPMLTPPKAAKILGVHPEKILMWIHSGELQATNVALNSSKRPRYRIQAGDLASFRNYGATRIGRPRRV
jgi:excisionase family DNA binding protein